MILLLTSNYDNSRLLINYKENDYKLIIENNIKSFISKYLTHLVYFDIIILDTRHIKDKKNILDTLITIISIYPNKKIIIIIHDEKLIEKIKANGIYNIISATNFDEIKHEINSCIIKDKNYDEISSNLENNVRYTLKEKLYIIKENLYCFISNIKLPIRERKNSKKHNKNKIQVKTSLIEIFSVITKIIYYLIAVAFASFGATVFINYILK